MKKNLILSCVLLLIHFVSYAVIDTAFVRTFGGKFKDVAYDIKQTYDNGFVLVGSTNSYGSGTTSVYLVKTDSNGIFQWSNTFGGFNINMGYSVQTNFDRGYSIVGYTNSSGNGGYDMLLIKTDSVGNKLWGKTYGGTDWDFGYSHAQLPDSGFVICGESYSYSNGSSDAYIVRTDKNGDTLWTRYFGGFGDDAAYSIIVNIEGNYIVAGKRNIVSGNDNISFIKLGSNGTLLAEKSYGGIKNDRAKSICPTNDNGFAILGTSNSYSTGGDNDAFLIKVNSIGDSLWSHLYGSTGLDEGNNVIQISNGDLDINGVQSGYGNGGTAMMVLRVNSTNGDWMNSAAFGGDGEETGYTMTRTTTGGIVYAGLTTSYGQGQEDMYFVKMYNDAIVADYTLQIKVKNDGLLSSITNYTTTSDELIVYPNPFHSSTLFSIKNSFGFKSTKFSFQLMDIYGHCVFQKEVNSSSFELEKGNLSSGTYFYTITGQDKIIRGKVVID